MPSQRSYVPTSFPGTWDATAETLVCDTSIASMLRFAVARPSALAHWPKEAFERLGAAKLTISAVTLAEVEYGFLKNSTPAELRESERRRLRSFGLLPIDPEIAAEWAVLRDGLRRAGSGCGDNDVWIAATARRRGATVVTADTDFLRCATTWTSSTSSADPTAGTDEVPCLVPQAHVSLMPLRRYAVSFGRPASARTLVRR